MSIIHHLKSAKFVENASALVIGSLGILINALYFTFVYFESTGNIIGQVWSQPIEHALVFATIPLYLAIGRLYHQEKKTSKELDASNKTKNLFIDIMRHDLLNPITITKGNAQLALKKEENTTIQTHLQNILENNQRLIDMIENASILARLESGEKLKFEEKDLGEILRNTAKDLASITDKKKMKTTVTSDGEYRASVNPLVYNLFTNLINNAIKYGHENTEVKIGIAEDRSNWKISVANNGEGIPDDQKKAVFDRFKRIKKEGVKGTGLGLAIVKKIANAHNGQVWVEDNPEGGSIFYVTLPKV